uniref:Uncharacterized protein n=1 Tax=Tetraselmis chuii TaxID=63592 RepID=A0A7S1SSN2_9CHLO|mmetsp:Transcript_27556/g.49141  ORF Transcript_27556/g.49141 Transcript_27556/m.49141 type:complete len:199 (+) Transcript_27556:248-844(+)
MPRRNSSSGEEAPLSAESSSDASSEDEVPALLNEAVHTGNLQLSSRMLDAVPPAVWTCAGLTRLDLSSNSFTHLPRQLSELWALEELDVSWNKLEELPGSTLGALTRLVTLRASYNQINAIPQQVASLPYLTSLDLSDNKLTSLPSVLCQSMSIQCTSGPPLDLPFTYPFCVRCDGRCQSSPQPGCIGKGRQPGVFPS